MNRREQGDSQDGGDHMSQDNSWVISLEKDPSGVKPGDGGVQEGGTRGARGRVEMMDVIHLAKYKSFTLQL